MANKKKRMIIKEKEDLKARLEKLPQTFTAATCGEVGAKGVATRVMCLERLKL